MTHRLALYVYVWEAEAQLQTRGGVSNEHGDILFTVENQESELQATF